MRYRIPALCLVGLFAMVVHADRLQLRGNASVTGKILAVKPEEVIIDLGYTVLVVPRKQILKMSRQEEARAAGGTNKVRASAHQMYYSADGSLPERSVREFVRKYGEAVVQVRTPRSLGSGFIINPDGYLMTNFHVIENETEISVELYLVQDDQLQRKSYKKVRIVAVDKFADLALLKIETKPAEKFAYLILGNSDSLAVGDHVFAVGSPMGLERTVTEGIVSTKTREFGGTLYLQTTAQINPGNSGGPLFNMRGEVVGVTNMKINFSEGLGFAIPVESVKYFLNHQDAFAYDNDNPSNPYRYLEPPKRMQQPQH